MKALSAHTFEVRLWSRAYYKQKLTPKVDVNIYNGFIRHKPSGDVIHFHSAGQFQAAVEKMYYKYDKAQDKEMKK